LEIYDNHQLARDSNTIKVSQVKVLRHSLASDTRASRPTYGLVKELRNDQEQDSPTISAAQTKKRQRHQRYLQNSKTASSRPAAACCSPADSIEDKSGGQARRQLSSSEKSTGDFASVILNNENTVEPSARAWIAKTASAKREIEKSAKRASPTEPAEELLAIEDTNDQQLVTEYDSTSVTSSTTRDMIEKSQVIVSNSNSSISSGSKTNYCLILGLIILVTFAGNVLVCLSVIKVRKLRHPSNYLLISLAISDLCVACVVMPFGLYQSINDKWQLGRLLCNVYVVSDVTSCTASILNLCVISIDRYLAITRPLTYCVKRTTRLMLILIAFVWICACLISGKLFEFKTLNHL